ncbi:hypothetical protein K440DRAFT_58379 [Wilcoxina mikolae CBS 423.85]|nr:hypothetical protein K440DRAFT_58379 [Wilcoxina mikolae CBS 423.85]
MRKFRISRLIERSRGGASDYVPEDEVRELNGLIAPINTHPELIALSEIPDESFESGGGPRGKTDYCPTTQWSHCTNHHLLIMQKFRISQSTEQKWGQHMMSPIHSGSQHTTAAFYRQIDFVGGGGGGGGVLHSGLAEIQNRMMRTIRRGIRVTTTTFKAFMTMMMRAMSTTTTTTTKPTQTAIVIRQTQLWEVFFEVKVGRDTI